MERERFTYTYSAKQQEEIRAIRMKYAAPEEDKMEQLRRLDDRVTRKATVVSLAAGVIGALLLGFGMSLMMSDLPALLGLGSVAATLLGIAAGVAGLLPIGLAYPLYSRTLRRERERIAPLILRLTEELLK